MVHFGEFLKTWRLQSNSVTRQVILYRTKIGGKCQNWKNANSAFLNDFQTLCVRPFKNSPHGLKMSLKCLVCIFIQGISIFGAKIVILCQNKCTFCHFLINLNFCAKYQTYNLTIFVTHSNSTFFIIFTHSVWNQ